jgi:hypothetical protein
MRQWDKMALLCGATLGCSFHIQFVNNGLWILALCGMAEAIMCFSRDATKRKENDYESNCWMEKA